MSGSNDTPAQNASDLTAEFDEVVNRRFEVDMARDFVLTHQDQLALDQRQERDFQAVEARYKADKANLVPDAEPAPRLDMEGAEQRDIRAEYDAIYFDYVRGIEAVHAHYDPMRDAIRENGEPLTDVFALQLDEGPIEGPIGPTPILSDELSSETDIDQLGVDLQYDFNSTADSDYYGSSVRYDYNEAADPFSADYNSYDNPFDTDASLTGPDHGDGHDGGRGR